MKYFVQFKDETLDQVISLYARDSSTGHDSVKDAVSEAQFAGTPGEHFLILNEAMEVVEAGVVE